MTPTEATRDYVSIGCLASLVQRSVRSIELAATKLGLVPAMRINHIPHFDADQVEQLTAELNQGTK